MKIKCNKQILSFIMIHNQQQSMIQKSTTAPLFIYGTRHGSLYNLTPTNLPKTIPAIQICYGDFHDYMETIKSLPQGMNFKKFLSYPQNVITYLTPYDFSKEDCMTGCHHNEKVKIKCNKGYTQINSQMYDAMVDLIKPEYFVGLTEYPSLQKDHKQQSNKSHKRAINKTKSYLQRSKFTRSQENDSHPADGPVRLAAVHGGRNLSLISRSLQQVLDHAIDGLVVCDLGQGQTIEQRQEIFKTINLRLEQQYNRNNSYFKNKKLKLVLAGLGKLQDIEHALKFGYEMFEINYPFLTAQKQMALKYNKQKQVYEQVHPVKKEQLKPLQADCNCHTCLNHSQAYIAHLIECYELTAKVLLSIHNIHVYERWLSKNKASQMV